MGAVKKIGKAISSGIKGVVQGVGKVTGGLLGQGQAAPQQLPAPEAPQPTAVQVQEAPVAQGEADIEGGQSTEAAGRRGKRGLTIKRTPVGGGRGLNV